MKSDGPYKHYALCSREPFNGLKCPACAYAEGRKSAENDFNELLEIADAMAYHRDDQSLLSRGFREWKKARGIE